MMTDDDLLRRYDAHYAPAATKFVEAVKGLDGVGMPEPHMPLWGVDYASSLMRVAFIGRDTCYWGSMNAFVESVKESPGAAIHRNRADFDAFKFTK